LPLVKEQHDAGKTHENINHSSLKMAVIADFDASEKDDQYVIKTFPALKGKMVFPPALRMVFVSFRDYRS